MRRPLVLFLGAAVSFLSLSACGSGDVSTRSASESASTTVLAAPASASSTLVGPASTTPGPRPNPPIAPSSSVQAPSAPAWPVDLTIVPKPIPETGVFREGPRIVIRWGELDAMLLGLSECSLRNNTCELRSRWMPGFTGATGAEVSLTVADINALVSVRVESVATGEVVVEKLDMDGTPTFTAPSQPGDYLFGIDLTGTARTVSYVALVRVSEQPAAMGNTAMTFPVNAVSPQG
jgi:hypothetical protein